MAQPVSRSARGKPRERRTFGRIRKLPSSRFQAAYTGPDGQLHTAPNTFAAKVDAEGWLSERRREIDRNLWSAPATADEVQSKRQRDLTFGEFAETWLQARTVKGRPLRPRTREHYRLLLDKHLLPAFGSKPLRAISPEMVDRWYAKTATAAPTLRAHCYSLLKTILESARTGRTRYIDSNPCLIDGAAATTRKIRPKPATVDELGELVENMPDRFQAMVLLASWCAMRLGELTELRRKDVDLDDGVIRIRRAAVRVDGGWAVGDPKSEAGARDVAIPPHLLSAIKRHLSKHTEAGSESLLFPADNGGHLQPSTLYRHYYKARTAAGRPDLRFHDLRHTGATMAAATGATLAELMDRLGHSTVQAALVYQHAAAGRDQEIAKRLSKLAKTIDR